MEEFLSAWTKAYGSNAKKLAWLKQKTAQLFDASVVKGGTGVRGGAIEKWLRHNYTPGDRKQTGQILDANGYLTVHASFSPVVEGRAFMDENEVYRSGADRAKSTWLYNYRMSNSRMLQMRRNITWTEKNSTVSPKMLNWMSLELGQTIESAPDACAWAIWHRGGPIAEYAGRGRRFDCGYLAPVGRTCSPATRRLIS